MTNPTALKFGYPQTTVAETGQWLVLVRPQQPTAGSLVLVCKEQAQAFSELSAAAFADLQAVVIGVERLLARVVDYARINYLMLMMVDRDVHFHIIPRYDGARELGGHYIPDAGWPGPPALSEAVTLDAAAAAALAASLRGQWRAPA
jgi:diadenosine tetraphosphate (Ap4A) HIT family hydrolase